MVRFSPRELLVLKDNARDLGMRAAQYVRHVVIKALHGEAIRETLRAVNAPPEQSDRAELVLDVVRFAGMPHYRPRVRCNGREWHYEPPGATAFKAYADEHKARSVGLAVAEQLWQQQYGYDPVWRG